MHPSVFIVGCARSGTTLLQRIVDSHPMIAVTPSMHWIRDLLRIYGVRKPDDPVSPQVVSALVKHPRFTRLQIDPEQVRRPASNEGEQNTHSALLSSIFRLFAEAAGKPLVGNKTAPFVRRIPELNRLWPGARFVHIVRDGRNVCLSMLDWESAESAAGRYTGWEADPISTTALWWRRKVLFGREGGRTVGPGLYHEVSYESLVSEPAGVCGGLCEFLGVPYDNNMLRFDEQRERMATDLERVHPTMRITAGLRDWRSQMPRESVELFEAVAGDLLENLGYPLVTDPKPETVELAGRMRESFASDADARGQKLPAGW